jgi:hypothetical protein
MRSYRNNSPEAAARIVALVLISDGHACKSEFESLEKADVARSLGLSPQALHGIVQTLCEDLLMEGFSGGSILSCVDDGSLASVLAEVDEAELRARVLRVAANTVHADRHLADGEAVVLDAIGRHWGVGALTATVECGIAEAPIPPSPSGASSIAHS